MPKYSKRPNIPGLGGLPKEIRTVLQPVKQLLDIHEGRAGNPHVDRFVRVGEIDDLKSSVYRALNPPADSEAPDPPSMVDVVAGVWGNRISWINATNDDLWAVEVFCATENNWEKSRLVASVTIPISLRGEYSYYMHLPSDILSDHYYWVRSVDYAGNASRLAPDDPFGGILAPGKDSIGEMIDTIMDILTPANAPLWDPGKDDYEAGDIVAHNGRQWQCYRAPVPVGTEPGTTGGADYWIRTGILVQGDVDGVPTVGVDGRLIVDQSIMARSILTDQLIVGDNITVQDGAIRIEHVDQAAVDQLEGMTDDEAALMASLQSQVDNKISVYVQDTIPSWSDVDANHDGDQWYKPVDKKWYEYDSDTATWWEKDDSIYNIEALAQGKTTIHYLTSPPTSGIGEDGDYCVVESGGETYFWKKVSGSWVQISGFENGATVGMTSDESQLVSTLQSQVDNKISVYVQDATPSWSDSNVNHYGDQWYKPAEKKWYEYTASGWVLNDDSIYNIEAYAQGKTTIYYGTSYPPSGLGEVGDFYFRDYYGTIIQYEKTGSSSWTVRGRFEDGATVGADWDGNLLNIPDRFKDEATDGINVTGSYLGYYNAAAGVFRSYIDYQGNFQFYGDSNNYINWFASAGVLNVKGAIHVTNPADVRGYLNVADGADNTQTQLDLGASIDNAIANGSTLIVGGLIRSDLLLVDSAQIKNGAITYAKIAEGEIGRAHIQDLAVDNAKIENLTIGTGKVQNDAISGKVGGYAASGIGLSLYWATTHDLSITGTGNDVMLFVSGVVTADGDPLLQPIELITYLEIRRNGTAIWGPFIVAQVKVSAHSTAVSFAVSFMDKNAISGINQYTAHARDVGSGATFGAYVEARSIALFEFKK